MLILSYGSGIRESSFFYKNCQKTTKNCSKALGEKGKALHPLVFWLSDSPSSFDLRVAASTVSIRIPCKPAFSKT